MAALTSKDILKLFESLDSELRKLGAEAELFLVGGAVMCLVYDARPSTHDVDALFRPAAIVREAAARVGLRARVGDKWLNDGVKGFLSEHGEFDGFLELNHLRVMVARADYMLAMKCMALRIAQESHDLDDIRYLLRHLNIETYEQAVKTIAKFYPLDRFPQKTLYALEELCA